MNAIDYKNLSQSAVDWIWEEAERKFGEPTEEQVQQLIDAHMMRTAKSREAFDRRVEFAIRNDFDV